MNGHRVAFTLDEHGIVEATVTCLEGEGAQCHIGCTVIDCDDWSHSGGNEEGCAHCMDLCCCDEDGRLGEGESCPDSHNGACPHEYGDLGRCWLLPCLAEWDGLRDDIYDLLRQPRAGVESWSVVYAQWECDDAYATLHTPGPTRREGSS